MDLVEGFYDLPEKNYGAGFGCWLYFDRLSTPNSGSPE
jgi:hypothetical protein